MANPEFSNSQEQKEKPLSPEAKEESKIQKWLSFETEEGPGQPEIHVESELIKIHAKTDIGGEYSKYQRNEDSMFAVTKPDRTIFGVIDGAGGSERGEQASQTASEILSEAFAKGKNMKEALEETDRGINKYTPGGYATAAVAAVEKTGEQIQVTLGYAGDCKIMTLRHGKKLETGATKFQNAVQQAIDRGEIEPHQYYTHPRLNLITGSLGGYPQESSQVISFEGEAGDVLVVGSDGFWDNVSEFEIEEVYKNCKTASEFQEKLYSLTYQRNNTIEPFFIQHSPDIAVEKTLSYKEKIDDKEFFRRRGDNLTLGVVEIK